MMPMLVPPGGVTQHSCQGQVSVKVDCACGIRPASNRCALGRPSSNSWRRKTGHCGHLFQWHIGRGDERALCSICTRWISQWMVRPIRALNRCSSVERETLAAITTLRTRMGSQA